MITSVFILDVLELTFLKDENEEKYKQQIPFLTVINIEHTGIGIFYRFSIREEAHAFRVGTRDHNDVIDAVTITIQDTQIDARAILFIKNGFIDCLEIWNASGTLYPKEAPEHYELETWTKGMSEKVTIRR